MEFSIAQPARCAPRSILARDSSLWGLVMACSKADSRSCQDCLDKLREVSVRLVQAAVSTAWAMASMPVAAATLGGWVAVRAGSRMARRGSALGSPQAIFTCVWGSEMSAYDCA